MAVRVVSPLTVMLCADALPSDQPANWYRVRPTSWVFVGADTDTSEPVMTVPVNGAALAVSSSVSGMPAGTLASSTVLVFGCSSTLSVSVSPSASVAVSRSSSHDGYSWSGATNDPAGPLCPVTVWVAGQKASVQYAGRSGYTAEDQVVFIVPQGVQGCYVQVAVQTTSGSGSVVGNFTSMTVDPNGDPCQDADGIDYNTTAIQTAINSKGSVNIGMIDLLSNYLTLDVFGTPFQWDNDTVDGELGTFTSGVLGEFQGFTISPSVGNCSVSNFLAYPPPIDPALALVTYLNAGSQLTISGPNGMQPVPTNTNGKGYGALVGGATIADLLAGGGANPYYLNASGWGGTSWTYSIESGNYTISGPGATGTNAVGAFSGTIPVSSDAAAFKWTNQSSFANPISRTSGMTITWTGGDPNGFVDITAIGSVLLSGLTPTATTPGVLVECMAPASAGTFTVPPYVLQTLPSTAGSAAAVPPGELLVGPASGAMPFSSTPTGLDAIYGFYHFIAGLNVTWQ